MNLCGFNNPNGINKDCEAFLAASVGAVFFDPEYSFATQAAAKLFSNWKAAIDTTEDAYVPRLFLSSEPTAAEPIVETAGNGRKLVTGFNPPSVNVFMSSSPCDFSEMVAMGSQLQRMAFLGSDGSKMMTKTSTGIIKGFECQVIAQPLGFIAKDNQMQQYKLIINFNDIKEFQNAVIWTDTWGHDELIDTMPIGYTLVENGALSTASQPVKITKRCKDSVLATDTFVSQILDYYTIAGTVPVVTVGAITAGLSTLLIYSTGTTPLASGEWVKFRLKKVTGSVIDEVTNAMTVIV